MIEQVIDSILDAEAEAEKKVSLAEEKSRALELQTEADCRKIKDDAVKEFKTFKKERLALKEKEAVALYDEILKKGNETAKKIEDDAMKSVDAVADKITGELLK